MKTNILISLVIVALVVILSVISGYFPRNKQTVVLGESITQENKLATTSLPEETETPLPTTPTPTSTPTIEPMPTITATPTPVPQPTETPTISAPADLEPLFESVANQYGVDKNLLKKIAKCESNFNSTAKNGAYGGMYQYTESRWIENRNIMGLDPNPELRFNAEESMKTAAFFMVRGGISMWPSCQ